LKKSEGHHHDRDAQPLVRGKTHPHPTRFSHKLNHVTTHPIEEKIEKTDLAFEPNPSPAFEEKCEKHNVIKPEQITVGLLNESLAHPREVLKPAIRESASALILVHNHTSGDPTPSQDDKIITKEIKKAAETLGLRILDHIILSKDKALSMVEEKIL